LNFIFIIIFSFIFTQNFYYPPLESGNIENGERQFYLQMQNGTHSFFNGIQTHTSGYNGNYLAPTLLLNKGEFVNMNVTNTMPFSTTTHWHGLHLPAIMDGGPHQLIDQNSTWIAAWEVRNRAGTYWYHPHPHPEGFPIDTLSATGWQVYQGLVGMIIINDNETASLGLPSTYGVDDFPLIIQDKSFNEDSTYFAPIPPQDSGLANLRRGETILTNGVVTPTLETHAQLIRFRILNASNARTYRLGFSDDRDFKIVASDGGILDDISVVNRLDISPAERYEIIVDFSDDLGNTIQLMSYNSEIESFTFPNGLSGNIYWISPLQDEFDVSDFEIMTFNIIQSTDNALYTFDENLTIIERIDPTTANNFESPRSFVLAAPPNNGNGFTINGFMFDSNRIGDIIQLGETEIWDIENTTNMAHPFHIHGDSFQVVSRTNGVRPIMDYELGWKDVVVVFPQEIVRIIKPFKNYEDFQHPFMSHCHILEHEDAGMMTHWVVVDALIPEIPLHFDGIDDRVIIPYSPSFPTDEFTLSAWIKLEQPYSKSAIIAWGEDDNSYNLSWQLYVSREGELEIMLEDENENNYCYPYNNCIPQGECTIYKNLYVADNEWHHVVSTRNHNGELNFYIDGEIVAECSNTGIPSSDNFQDVSIGCTFGAIGPPPDGIEPPIWFFNGQIDNPSIWNLSFTHEDVLQHYSNGINENSEGLIGFWNFNEGSGQVVIDQSLFENNGYLGDTELIDNADPTWNLVLGDVNQDGVINILDILLIVNIVLGNSPFNANADLNNDLIIDILDIIITINIILN